MLQPPGGRFVERDDVLSWGRVVREPQRIAKAHFRDELPQLISEPRWQSKLAIGLRRSYGNSCLNGAGALIDATGLDRFMAFDRQTGRIRAEAGVGLSKALQLVVPHGWFLPTTPGTRFVTFGGAVANDVHGKNHHRAGAFGAGVVAIGLQRSDGSRLTLTPELETELFCATIGGLGLTGVIEWVELQLVPVRSAYLNVEILPYAGLDAFWAIAEESIGDYEHTVAWIDCVSRGSREGRGVFTRANWAEDGGFVVHDDRALNSMPIEFPSMTLNRLSVAAFNEFYYGLHRLKRKRVRQDYWTWFYPLELGSQLEPALRLARHVAVSVRDPLGRRTGRHARPSRRDLSLGSSFLPGGFEDVRRPSLAGLAVLPPAGRDSCARLPQPRRGNARAHEPT